MPEPLIGLLLGLAAGILFGIYGYLTKRDENEPFKYKKLGRTVTIYAAAGLLVAYQGKQITRGNIVAATSTTAILGKIFDDLYARLSRQVRKGANKSGGSSS